MLRLLLACFLATVAPALATDFRPILREEARRHPRLRPQDCYKLIYQACLGSEHAVADAATAARWLERELATLGPGPDEPLVGPIAPDGSIVRVNLRPFTACKGDPARLAKAFVQTAAGFRGSKKALPEAWTQVVQLAEARELPFMPQAAREFGEKMAQADYPAVHHSPAYAAEYKPAYRVIAREYLAGILPK